MNSQILTTFDLICVLDFEATCETKEQMNKGDMEVIEFPSVLLDCKTLEVVDEFQRFCKTKKFPVSPYCTEVTGITQQKIDEEGMEFTEVIQLHQSWLASHGAPHDKSVIFVTCGDWDLKTMMPRQCKQYELDVPTIYHQWINIKKPFSYRLHTSRPGGMAKMLKVLRIPLEGRHHSGIDDCRNITKIVVSLMKKKTPMKATGCLENGISYKELSEEAGYGCLMKRRR